MAKPPTTPITIKRGDKEHSIDYFEYLILIAYDLLKEDGIHLNFKGYKDTVSEYSNLDEKKLEDVWRLAKDLNSWSEYLSGMCNLIQKMYLDSETEKAQVISVASIQADHEKVSNGRRIADQNTLVINIRKKRNTLQSFHNELESKIKFLERAHYHCKATYDSAMKKYVIDNTTKEQRQEQ